MSFTSFPGSEAFRRADAFGEYGQGPFSISTKLRLIFGVIFLLPIKALGALGCLLSYWVFCRLSWLVPSQRRGAALAAVGRLHCRACLFCIGFLRVRWVRLPAGVTAKDAESGRVSPEAAAAAAEEAPVPPGCGGVVASHASWADILLHMSRSFPAFVARDSTANLPLVGIISQCMRCVFVDRNRKDRTTGGVSEAVRQRMQQTAEGLEHSARPLLLFPEGTTTNGKCLLNFKTGAFLAGVPVRPVFFRYQTPPGGVQPTWDMIPAPKHIFYMLCMPYHVVTCYELPVYVPNEDEKADPHLYANNVRNEMLKASGFFPSDATFDQKMRLKAAMIQKHFPNKGKKKDKKKD